LISPGLGGSISACCQYSEVSKGLKLTFMQDSGGFVAASSATASWKRGLHCGLSRVHISALDGESSKDHFR
jgi:hypothetical protein